MKNFYLHFEKSRT